MSGHRENAEKKLAEAPQESDGTWALAQAQMATAHAVLALADAVAELRTPCPCEDEAYDDWPMESDARPVADVARPDLFGDVPDGWPARIRRTTDATLARRPGTKEQP
ncbi:hypothetical protein [Nocardiopsis sp. YSL2]|uniref:hypothetical protein n=1 Tax=Nocardiopsis sp. YSL2 TaxID=2939492 RepID=UPI0026F47D22|nr:hypothetical protein [Nocardiopsis sp. YSL2]